LNKILLSSLLITSLYSDQLDPKIYFGTSYGYVNEVFSKSEYDTFVAQSANVKIGYGIRSSYAVEFSVEYIQKDENDDNGGNVFSTNDGDRYSINIEIMKAFDFDIYINPFFKGGFGAGFVDIENSNNESLNFSSYNLGGGFFIPVNEHFDFEVGYNYKFTSYEKIQEGDEDLTSHKSVGYLGVNVRF
jgi:opacity protein-like surface antigen